MAAKKKKLRNFKKFSFEFLSIFIAVISAFALNNWNDNRKDDIAARKILQEINNGLARDTVDVAENIQGHKWGNQAVTYFMKLANNQPVSRDSFFIHYVNLTRDFVSLQNKSGYETLKSRGLELIKNDSLREKIIHLYEYEYEIIRKMEESYFEMQYQANYFKDITQMLSPHFERNEEDKIIGLQTPLNLTPSDRNVLMIYLWKIRFNRGMILQYYANVEEKISDLQQDIKLELGT